MKLSSKFSNSEPDLPKFNTGIYRDTVGTIFATDLCESIRVSENNFSTLHNSKLAHIMISNKEVREKSKSAPCLKPKKPDEVELLSQALNELEVAVKYGRDKQMHVDLYKERTPIMVLVHGKEMTQAYEKAFEEAAELLRMVKLNLESKKVIEHEQKRGAYATICTTTMELEKQLNTWATSVNGSLQEMKKEIRMELEEMWRTIAS